MTLMANLQLLDGISGPAGKAAAAMLRVEQAAVNLQSAMNRETDLANGMERAAQKVDLLTGTLGYQKNAVASLERQMLAAATAGDPLVKQQRDAELAAQSTELLGKVLDQAKQASDGASEGVEKTGKAAEKSGNKAKDAVKSFVKLASSLLSIKNVKATVTFLFEGAAKRQQQQAQMEALLGGTGGKLFQQYEKRAQVTAFETKDYVAAMGTISKVTEKESELTRIMSQAERAAAKRGGALDTYAEALRSIYSGDVSGAQKTLGLTNAETEALKAAKGVEELDAAIEAALARMGATDALVEKMGMTAASRWQNLKEKISAGFAEAGQGVLEKLTPVFEKITAWLDGDAGQKLFLNIQIGIEAVAIAISNLMNIAVGVIDWIVGLAGGANNAAEAAERLGSFISIMVPVLGAAAIAWGILNAVMNANPFILIATAITLIIVTIAGLIAYFVSLWKTNDEFYVGFMQIWNKIVGFIVDQVPLYFWKAFAAITNFIQKFNADTLMGIQNLVNSIISGINWMIEQLNKIPGVSIQAIGQVEFGTKAQMEAEALKQRLELNVALMEDRATQNAAKREADLIASVLERQASRAEKDTQVIEDTASGVTGLEDLFSGAGGGSGGKVHMDEPIEISSEDLKIMRDLAEREAIQYFVSLYPSVTVSGNEFTNRSGMDANELADAIGQMVREDTEAAVSGVYPQLQPV